jgi:hypothetical protein
VVVLVEGLLERPGVVVDVRREPRHLPGDAEPLGGGLPRRVRGDVRDVGGLERRHDRRVPEALVLTGGELPLVDREPVGLRPLDVPGDLGRHLPGRQVVEVPVLERVVQPPEVVHVVAQRVAHTEAVHAVDVAPAPVEGEVQPEVLALRPRDGPTDVLGGHADHVTAAEGGLVRLHVPAEVREEDVVDVDGEEVVAETEVDAARGPAEQPV